MRGQQFRTHSTNVPSVFFFSSFFPTDDALMEKIVVAVRSSGSFKKHRPADSRNMDEVYAGEYDGLTEED